MHISRFYGEKDGKFRNIIYEAMQGNQEIFAKIIISIENDLYKIAKM